MAKALTFQVTMAWAPAVFVPAFPEWESMITRTVTADDGHWVADFSVPGDGPEEQETVKLTGMSAGLVAQFDDEGNATVVWWAVSKAVSKGNAGRAR